MVREAVACGTPCVVTALPGVAEEIGAECGIVVPRDDPEAFAGALEEVLRASWDRTALRRRALAWRWERNAEETLRVLAQAVGARTREVA